MNGSQIVSEIWGNNTLIYLYDETGSPIGMQYRTSSMEEGEFVNFFFEKNLFGDIVAIYNEAGNKIGSYKYDAWGICTTSVQSTASTFEQNIVRDYNPFRYRGYYYDTETEFYYLQSRYYDPVTGRFLNADGYINANGDMIGYNMYAYCSNSPVMYTDPTGLLCESNVTIGTYAKYVNCAIQEPTGWWIAPKYSINKSYFICRDFIKKFCNQSDTIALYDNKRFEDKGPFHEEILRLSYSTPSLNFLNGDLGLGSLSVDAVTGGWEWKHLDISLLDFGHAEVSAEIKNWTLEAGAFASIWSPSIAVTFGKLTFEVGAEVGAIGAEVKAGAEGFSLKGAYEIGASLNISW